MERNNQDGNGGRGTLALILLLGVFMALMPLGQEPHLLQKGSLLFHGWLHKPMDWFDLFLHGAPLLFAAAYAMRRLWKRGKN